MKFLVLGRCAVLTTSSKDFRLMLLKDLQVSVKCLAVQLILLSTYIKLDFRPTRPISHLQIAAAHHTLLRHDIGYSFSKYTVYSTEGQGIEHVGDGSGDIRRAGSSTLATHNQVGNIRYL
jgi:hypothetical protein